MVFQTPRNCVVGQVYLVPCVRMKQEYIDTYGCGPYLPIFGPARIDGVEVCIDDPIGRHYHVDRRFVPKDDEKNIGYNADHYHDDVEYVEMKCVREISDNGQLLWGFIRLIRVYQNHILDLNNPVCPHQKQNIVNSNGMCSAHGLCWDLKTGQLKWKLPLYLRFKGYSKKYECVEKDIIYMTVDEETNTSIIQLYDANDQLIGETFTSQMRLFEGDEFKLQTRCVPEEKRIIHGSQSDGGF